MKSKRNLLIAGAAVAVCLVGARLAISIPDRPDSHRDRGNAYYVEPEITIPEYKTDAARAIDAYERLMERYMELAESRLGADCQTVTQKLDSIDSRMTELSARLAGIEKALGIDPNGQQKTEVKSKK